MFNDWKAEKAVQALVDEAQDLADKLASAKPHIRDAYAAGTWYWATAWRAEGRELYAMASWTPAELQKFTKQTAAKIAALRKARAYERLDGLTVWLQVARALAEPRVKAPLAEIAETLSQAGPNAPTTAEEMLEEDGLPFDAVEADRLRPLPGV